VSESSRPGDPPREVPIREPTIRLGQLLKLAGIAASGSEAKQMLADGLVRVNGAPETRRGRRLQHGDVVGAGAEEVRVSSAGAEPAGAPG
jgi:ribosome-associated protein